MRGKLSGPIRIGTGVVLGLASVILCSAASVTTFYDYSAFEDALAPGTQSITESFSRNQINTPGLTITACGSTGRSKFCTPAASGELSDDRSSFSNNQFSSVVGRLNGVAYTQTFMLPNETTSLGFYISENPSPYSPYQLTTAAFGMSIGGVSFLAPFGGFEGPNDRDPGLPNPSFPCSGFVGFVSDTPFDFFTFDSTYGDPASYTIDDITFATPEPATLGLAGLAIVGMAATRFRRSAK